MRMPVTFPPKAFEHGELLSGLGTPDLSGRIGKPFYFTSELFFQPKGGGDFSVEVVELVDNKGRHRDRDQGAAEQALPRSRSDYITIPMTLDRAPRTSRSLGIAGLRAASSPSSRASGATGCASPSPSTR